MLSRSLLSSPLLPLLLSAVVAPVSAVWPAPQSFTSGSSFVYINEDVYVTYNGEFLPYTYGYSPSDTSSSAQIVQGGLSRTLGSIFTDAFVPWMLHARNEISEYEPDLSDGQTWLSALQIVQTAPDAASTFKPLDGEVDESYNLTLSAAGVAELTAVSSTGVLRGLETFAQLFYQHSSGTFWYTPYAPVAIQDAPKYAHRGVMLDTARSFYPVSDILRTIDAIAWNKMNRLHIHATDSQSWSLDIPSMPEVAAKGAYQSNLIYTAADVQNILQYGVARGVEVIWEIDMPGHIGSLSWSHPELIVAYDAQPYYWWCAEPPCGAFKLNDSAVDTFLGALFDDLLPRLVPYTAYFHTGGDELNANDSMLDPGIRSNSSAVLQPLLQSFIDTQHARVRAAGLTPMTWEEVPLDWNVTLGNDTIVQTWLGASSVDTLTAMGHKVIDSDYNYWYLDCGRGQWLTFENGEAFDTYYPFPDWCTPTKAWQLIYSHDPAANLSPEQAALVVGGELAVWGETIDSVNLDTLMWPRASAAGEVLWSGRIDPATGQNRSQLVAAPRLNEFRYRLVSRGVSASPVQMLWCSQAANATECSYPM